MQHLHFIPSTVIVNPGIQSIMKWLAEFLNVGHGYGKIAFFLFFWQGSFCKLIVFHDLNALKQIPDF